MAQGAVGSDTGPGMTVVFASLFGNAFSFLADRHHLVLSLAGQHMKLSVVALAIAMALALPIGLTLGHLHRGSFLAINGGNVLRAVPSFALLAILTAVVGIGFTNALIAMFVLAFAPILTNVYVAVDGVDQQTVDAARGMGMGPLRIALRVELPLALPLIFAGLRTATVFVVASATLASVIGAHSLGDIIFNEASYHLSGVLGAAIAVTLLSFIVQLVLIGAQRLLTPRGLRASVGRAEPGVATGEATGAELSVEPA